MKKKDSLTFEKKLKRLEQISELLESDETELEDALKLFEEGINLSKECLTALKEAEIKITELKAKIDLITPESKRGPRKNNFGDE